MRKIQSYEISEKVETKFGEVTGINLNSLFSANIKPVKSASFDKFTVSDIINLKLLTVQGVSPDADVKLISRRKFNGTGKAVYMLMIQGNKIKSFYQCYIEEKPVEVKPVVEKKGLFSKKPQAPKTTETLFSLKTNEQIRTSTDVAQFIEEQKNFNKSLLDIVMELKKK